MIFYKVFDLLLRDSIKAVNPQKQFEKKDIERKLMTNNPELRGKKF